MGAIQVNAELGVVSIDLAFTADGKAWAKVRAVSKERVRDSNGTYTDGDPTFIDVVVNGHQAVNMAESLMPGDLFTVSGKLVNREWTDNQGAKRDGWRINAFEVGTSLRFTSAPTKTVRDDSAPATTAAPPAASTTGWDEPPF